jgi:DNA-binding transcriptional ArsR family regulator
MIIRMKRSPAPARSRRSTADSRSVKSAASRTRPAASITAHPADNGADENDTVFASVARYFSLLADATRLKILHTICQSEQSVSAIVQATGASQTNVSRHLALLHQAAVVGRRKDGNAVYYQVADPELISICRTVCVQIAGRIDAGQPLREELLEFAGRAR